MQRVGGSAHCLSPCITDQWNANYPSYVSIRLIWNSILLLCYGGQAMWGFKAIYEWCITIFTPSYTKNFPSVNEKFGFCGRFRFPGCKDDFFNFSRKTKLCKSLHNRMTAKSWSFGDSEWAFDDFSDRKSISKSEGSWIGWSIRWTSIVGNQYCVVHLGIIMIPMVLSLISFNMAAPTRLKEGNAYILWVFQLKLKAFTAMQYGSGIKETYLSICLLKRVSNRSTCGLKWNLSHRILHNFWESIYSVLPLKTRDIVFSAPGMGLEEIEKSLFCANSHIHFAISLQMTECMPPILLMYANAVLWSVTIWTCLTLQLCLKYDFRANKMALVPKH